MNMHGGAYIVGAPVDEIRIGSPVRAVVERGPDDTVLLRFRLDDQPSAPHE